MLRPSIRHRSSRSRVARWLPRAVPGVLLAVAAFGLSSCILPPPPPPATTHDLRGFFTITAHTCTGGCRDLHHVEQITSMDLVSGSFSGNGRGTDPGGVPWTVTGVANGDTATAHLADIGIPYSADATLSISDNSASGTWTDSSGNAGTIVSTRDGCASAEFIGVRGSGDSYDATFFGMGPTISAVSDRVQKLLPVGQTLQRYGVDYPAVPITFPALLGYFPSVADGKATLEFRLHEDAKRCSQMKVVIGGFSQGAHVVGDAIAELANNNDPVLSNVKSVAIYGDPKFNPNDTATARGDYDPSHSGLLGTRDPYSSLINNRLGDWCRLQDPICQGPPPPIGDTSKHEYLVYQHGLFLDQGASLMRSGLGW